MLQRTTEDSRAVSQNGTFLPVSQHLPTRGYSSRKTADGAHSAHEHDGIAQSHGQFAILESLLLFSFNDLSHWLQSMCVFFARIISAMLNAPENMHIELSRCQLL